MTDNLEDILEMLDKIIEIPSELKNSELEKCLSNLEKFPKGSKDADFFYIEGYINYLKIPSNLPNAMKSFEKALIINNKHNFARMYYGYCLYDTENFAIAKIQFKKVRKHSLSNFLQMKLEEIIVCCNLRDSFCNKVSLSEATNLVKKYISQNYLDDYLFELDKTLKHHNFSLAQIEKQIFG